MEKKVTHATALLYPKHYFLDSFQNIVLNCTPNNKSDEAERDRRVKEFVGGEIDDEKFQNLAAYCNADRLRMSEDTSISSTTDSENMELLNNYYEVEPVLQNTGLQTLEMLQSRIKIDPGYRFSLNLKYRSVKSTELEKTFQPVGPPDLIPGKDILYRIRMYKPFFATKQSQTRHPTFTHDVVVYGSQTLDVLRDAIQCPNEKSIRLDMSKQPDAEMPFVCKDFFKSGFIFVEDTFYNDYRDPDNFDYSECIRQWAIKRGLPKFLTANMKDVTFDDLKFRLGHPQVYQHIGNCEHLLLFSEVRLLQHTDVCHSSFYPVQSIVAPTQIHYCMACRQFGAKWLVTDSDRIMFHPTLYCGDCFMSFNYVDGKKIGNFKAYPYSQSNCSEYN